MREREKKEEKNSNDGKNVAEFSFGQSFFFGKHLIFV